MNLFNTDIFSEALLTKRCVKLKIGIREVAKEIGISPATLSRCENGKDPSIHTYYSCCKWLGIEMEYFFNKTNKLPCAPPNK